ncbi:MAG: ABC transporter substrate-binding protein, partial [Acidimicrobiales bacterium]
PDPAAPTLTGAAVRAMVLPQLFVARADGRWMPSLVVGGSDTTAPDGRSATFTLRPGTWSDGTPVSADDLRRSADARFVAGVDGPATDGMVTVRFTQPLPGWRRLWSGVDSVGPPAAGVWGGPFVVASYEPGLEVVLRRHDGWYGRAGPFLDELRLVLVPDDTIARQLLSQGDLDVVMPPASTARTPRLEAIEGVEVATSEPTGWWVGLVLRPDRWPLERRRAVVATVDRTPFVITLLADEATELTSFVTASTWASVRAGDSRALRGAAVEVTGQVEEPMSGLLRRSMQKRARAAAGRLELRVAEADRVEPWVAAGQYQVALVMHYDSPAVCWTCRWAGVDEALARSADSGDRGAAVALETRLRDEALVLPLWRPRAVVAWRTGLLGPRANGFALSAAWNAWEWSRPTGHPVR